jgi:hypothetical protein
MVNRTQTGSAVVSRDDDTGSCSEFMQTARRPLYDKLRLGDGGVRSGVGSFDGRKSATARKNRYHSPAARRCVRPWSKLPPSQRCCSRYEPEGYPTSCSSVVRCHSAPTTGRSSSLSCSSAPWRDQAAGQRKLERDRGR